MHATDDLKATHRLRIVFYVPFKKNNTSICTILTAHEMRKVKLIYCIFRNTKYPMSSSCVLHVEKYPLINLMMNIMHTYPTRNYSCQILKIILSNELYQAWLRLTHLWCDQFAFGHKKLGIEFSANYFKVELWNKSGDILQHQMDVMVPEFLRCLRNNGYWYHHIYHHWIAICIQNESSCIKVGSEYLYFEHCRNICRVLR